MVATFGVGLYMSGLVLSPAKLKIYSWHKWAGLTIFALVLFRLFWRLGHRPPAAPAGIPAWQHAAAEYTHYALMVVSAHWEVRVATADLSGAPETLHDFAGFPPALYRMQYPAPGAPHLAERAVVLLFAAGMAAELHPDCGLDHGAWAPLSAMYPQANVPVTQLSLLRNGGVAAHVALGQVLAPLRDEGVLIVASGAITHNFGWLDWHAKADQLPVPQAQAFTDWVAEQLAMRDVSGMLAYRTARYGADAHPSEEHFLPLFVALGAANGDTPRRYRPDFAYGGMAMDALSMA